MALLARLSFSRAAAISTGANCRPSAPAALSSASLDTATLAVASVCVRVAQPALARTARVQASNRRGLGIFFIFFSPVNQGPVVPLLVTCKAVGRQGVGYLLRHHQHALGVGDGLDLHDRIG